MMTDPFFSGTILCISDADLDADSEGEFYEYCESNRNLLRPFLYLHAVCVKPGEPWETKFPIVAMFTTNGKIPNKIDPSQLCSIGYSSKYPTIFDDANPDDSERCEVFDFLNSHHGKLPNLTELTIYNGRVSCVDKIYSCMFNSQFKRLKFSRFEMIEDPFAEKRRNECQVFPLHSLEELSINIEHMDCIDKLPDCDNLKKFILHLTKMKRPILGDMGWDVNHFNANQHFFLEYCEVFCESSALVCYVRVRLPNTSCLLHTFKSNATPEQAEFIVYGTEDANGALIPGNNDWVANLTYIEIPPDFYWFVQTSIYVFEKRYFNDVTLRKDVIIRHSKLETEDPPSNTSK